MKLVIYTAIFGDIKDSLHEPQVPPEIPCHAYIEGITEPEERNGWLCMPAVWEHATNPRLRARRHKLLVHQLYPDVQYSLWVDGCLTPKTDPYELIEQYLGRTDITLFRHMQRNCLYKELEACLALRKDAPSIMRAQVNRYRKDGYPYNAGLGETTALLRRHTDAIKEFNEAWWRELRHNSVRDQLSFNYLAWKLGLEYNTFEGNRCKCPHFDWRAHR
jgi:hypothetical protein